MPTTSGLLCACGHACVHTCDLCPLIIIVLCWIISQAILATLTHLQLARMVVVVGCVCVRETATWAISFTWGGQGCCLHLLLITEIDASPLHLIALNNPHHGGQGRYEVKAPLKLMAFLADLFLSGSMQKFLCMKGHEVGGGDAQAGNQ